MDLQELKQRMDATRNAAPLEITVPVWGKMFVRPQTVEEADQMAQVKPEEDGRHRRLARNAAQVICDEHGVRLFNPASKEDLDYLNSHPWELLHKVVSAATGIYGEGGEAEKK